MCQMKSDTIPNVHLFGFLDRNQKMIVTYSRSKLARTKSTTILRMASMDYITVAPLDMDKINCFHVMGNGDYELTKNSQMENVQSAQCDNDKTTIQQNAEYSLTDKLQETSDHMINEHEHENHPDKFNSNYQSKKLPAVFRRGEHHTNSKRIQKIHSKSFKNISNTKVSDCFLVLVCLTFLTVHQVFGKPYPSMSLEAQLRSPCGKGSAAKEELTRANVQQILNVITTQTANAKVYAFDDVEKYMSHRPPTDIIDNTVDSDKKLRLAESPEIHRS